MFKRIVALTLLIVIGTTGHAFAYDSQLKPFKDVKEKDYALESVYFLSALGIIQGFPDMTFKPEDSMSREAFIKLLVSTAKIDIEKPSGSKPADVSVSSWSYPYIAAAYERKWIDFLIDKDGALHPGQTITREEVAALMGRFLLESQPADYSKQWLATDWETERDQTAFKDQSKLNAALQPYIYYSVNQGIMMGDLNGFSPNKPLSRKQAAAVLYRLIDSKLTEQSLDITGYYAISSYSAIQHMPSLTNVAFGWSHMEYKSAGTAELNTASTEYRIPNGSAEALTAADQAQIGKELMIYYTNTNLKDFIKDQSARTSFIDSLMVTLEDPKYGFTGINLDFEGLREVASRADFLSFVKELKGRMGDLTLAVTVPPTDYFKGYDLKGIGEIADTVILMAYDFTHEVSNLPSAPLPLVNETVVDVLKSVPKHKLVLGISKQANQWITKDGKSELFKPKIIDVENRLKQLGVTQSVMMPFFLNQIKFQDERGTHEVFYEDTNSIAKKIALAKFYGLKGISLWHMGNFTASDWELIAQEKAAM